MSTLQQLTNEELIEMGATAAFHAHHEHHFPSDHHTAEAVIAAVRPHIEAQARAQQRRAVIEECIALLREPIDEFRAMDRTTHDDGEWGQGWLWAMQQCVDTLQSQLPSADAGTEVQS